MLELLLQAGADINATELKDLGTPLLMALWQKKLPVANLLLGRCEASSEQLLGCHGILLLAGGIVHASDLNCRKHVARHPRSLVCCQ
jgi:ankyrin repeat protein